MRIRATFGDGIRVLIALFAFALASSPALAQVAGTQADVGGCVACHIGADAPGSQRFVRNNRAQEFVKLSESKTWESRDPHQLAYDVLKPANPVAKRMQELLANGKADYEVIKDYRCLTCHSTDLNPTSKAPRVQKEFVGVGTGVGCAACHGVGEKWQAAHWIGETVPDKSDGQDFVYFKWRTETPAFKQAAGLNNLRDPQVKADLCASCHVGNPDENKVITHEMYAAGHPPLPPMELVSYMENEPRHWGYPSEMKFLKDFAAKDPAKAWEIFRFKPEKDEVYLARHVSAGAIASLKAEMKLLEAEAVAAEKRGDGLDYARFDCYSCHHDLKYPSPRQERGYADRIPGRPPLKAWVAALPSMVISQAGGIDANVKTLADQFPTAWKAVAADSTSAPFAFGKAAAVAKSAKAVSQWCDNFNKSLDTVNFSDAATDGLIAKLKVGIPSNEWRGDTEATMSLLWAYRSLKLARKQNPEELDVLDDLLPTRIRNAASLMAEKEPTPAGKLLPARLKLFANFDPTKFDERFKMLK